MAKRYYFSKMIGTGSEFDPMRPAVSDYGVNFSAEYDPAKTDALCIVGTGSHTALLKDAALYGMPDYPLDGKLSAMRSATLNALNTAVTGRGFTVTWGSADAYRDVIRSIGRQINPNFDENNFDVQDQL